MNLLKKIGAFLASIFSPKTADAILAGIRRAQPYIDFALKLSQVAASIVGGPLGKSAAAVIAIAEDFGVSVFVDPHATDEQIGTAIRDAIAKAIHQQFPGAKTADVNRAIELAYGAVRK